MSEASPFSLSEAPEGGRVVSVSGPFDLSAHETWALLVNTDDGLDACEIVTAAFDCPSEVTAPQLCKVYRDVAGLLRMTPKAQAVKLQRAKLGSTGWIQVMETGRGNDLGALLNLAHDKEHGQDPVGAIAAPSAEVPQTEISIKNENGVPLTVAGCTIIEGAEQTFMWNGAEWVPED